MIIPHPHAVKPLISANRIKRRLVREPSLLEEDTRAEEQPDITQLRRVDTTHLGPYSGSIVVQSPLEGQG